MLQAPLKRKRGRINESVEQPEIYNQGYNNSAVNPLLGTDNLIRSLNQAVDNKKSDLSDEEKAEYAENVVPGFDDVDYQQVLEDVQIIDYQDSRIFYIQVIVK